MNSDLSPAVPFKTLPNTKAWKLLSEYVRKASGSICYTCGKKYPHNRLNAGHFIEKIGNVAIYFDLRGIGAQCFYCNRRRHGNKEVFAEKLTIEYVPEIISGLLKIARKSKVWTKHELEIIATALEAQIAGLGRLKKAV